MTITASIPAAMAARVTYSGRVSAAVKSRRRAANRTARASRRVNRPGR